MQIRVKGDKTDSCTCHATILGMQVNQKARGKMNNWLCFMKGEDATVRDTNVVSLNSGGFN